MCWEKRFAMRTFQKGLTFRIKRASTLKEKDGIIKTIKHMKREFMTKEKQRVKNICEKMLQNKTTLDEKNLNCSSHALLAIVWKNTFLYHC